MRFAIPALALLGVGALALAVAADPAPTTQPERTATPAAPALSAQEQRLLSQGYKPHMRDGEKIYCRRESELGSRISTVQHCGSVAELTTTTQDGKDYLRTQRTQINPVGH